MADGYWRYADPRQQVAVAPTPAPLKRPRSEYVDMPGAPEMLGYYPRNEDRTALGAIRDAGSINSSYDPYLRNGLSSYVTAEHVRPIGGGITSRPVDDPRMPGHANVDSRVVGYSSGRIEAPLPPDASNTLFVEGLPADCTRREVSHIFRPFVGFQEVRLVTKDSKHPGGDPFVLCFVDFTTSSQAAVALDALQAVCLGLYDITYILGCRGYCFDEHDRESARLRLQYARFPGPRSFAGPRSRR